MRYLLSEEEFNILRLAKAERESEYYDKIQDLCTLAAKHIPVPRPWMGEDAVDAPWGCILDGDGDIWMGYCDDCPCTEVCPNDNKNWSQ